MNIQILLIILVYSITLIHTRNLHFSNVLQRFTYDDLTDTIILASVNHIYSINASDLTILSDIDTTPSLSAAENDSHCLNSNKTSLATNLYYFPASTYLFPTVNSTFNQLLLVTNHSVLICSTSNRRDSCQLRSLTNLNLLRNSSERLVSSSPLYPSIGFISERKHVLYLANTYDVQCDPFYKIPTISGRFIDQDFLSIINLNSGQSALQQSTYTLRLLNNRLVRDFFLHYLYGFEHRNVSYFLTIQQSDLHHSRKSRLQTKILRFCQSLNQSIIKSYVEIPVACGQDYHYLVTAKFSKDNQVLYGVFRNTTLANASTTGHAVCAYAMDSVREAFFQTIKRCLVDGKGYRGLGFISPDTHCQSNKNINDINHDYCPDDDDSFFQYPIGGHRSLEQIEPIIELDDKVNFTVIEIVSMQDDVMILLGDDHGTVHTFQTSNIKEVHRQTFPSSSRIIDLKLIHKRPSLANANLLVLTNNQIIEQNLSTCEQYKTCDACFHADLCHWCSSEKRCTPTFECTKENAHHGKQKDIHICTNIERVIPETVPLQATNTQLEIVLNVPLQDNLDEYQCQFRLNDEEKSVFYSEAILRNDHTLKCLPPTLNNISHAVYHVVLRIYHLKANSTFGYSNLVFVNCSNFLSCSSCTTYSNQCLWNTQTVTCIFQEKKKTSSVNRKRFLLSSNQCPMMYLQQSINRLPYNQNKTLTLRIEQCYENLNIKSCQLSDNRQRLLFISSTPIFVQSNSDDHLCLLKCPFELSHSETIHQISYHRPLHLNLSLEFLNKTSLIVPRTHISLYRCDRLALNCTSCLQLDPAFGCVWCNNMCILKTETIANQLTCPHNEECLTPIMQVIEPLLLPMNGGTIVTIKGKHFELFNLTVHLADVPCRVIEEESSSTRIVCQSGDTEGIPKTGFVYLKFGLNGPQLRSHQRISYLNPKIDSIEPLAGIESGGTILTIQGENLTIGNGLVSIFVGARPCQLLSISQAKIQCETSSFPSLMLNEQQPMKFLFDRQTKMTSEKLFTIAANPILYSFDKSNQFKSFMGGGHQLIIHGEHFQIVQNIRLEFKRILFVSPIFRNETHLIFLTPSIQELHLNSEHEYQQEIEIIVHLDHFNQSSSLMYINDPLIYELEPMLQTYTNELMIHGMNLTSIGHTKNDIGVHIGCDLCPVVYLRSDRIVCQPPSYRPKKYSKTNRPCYDSEHPWIIVTIDNIHSHVGYLMYPKKIIILGIISGCLLTILLVVLIVLLIVCIRIRCAQRKARRRYLYGTGIDHPENDKEPYTDNLIPKAYQKLQPSEPNIPDSPSFTTIPIRSYLNYLQLCYYYYSDDSTSLPSVPSYDTPKATLKHEVVDQFQLLMENSPQFVECFCQILLKSNKKKLLNSFILTQRYHFKKLLQFNHDVIYWNICMLTAYDDLLTNQLTSLFFQLYYQLKHKIHSGPIDAIEQTCSFYSLNNNTILHDQSIIYNSIQVVVHIDSNNSDDLFVFHVTCLTCDTISQVKDKILQQLDCYKRVNLPSKTDCHLYLLTSIKSNHTSCSASSCSSSSTSSSSNVPLAKKSLLTQFFSHRNTAKYSTTTTTTTSTLTDPYKDSVILLLNDVDNTNEQMNHCKKLNTLQHYGILTDGYEFKFVVPPKNKQNNYINQLNHTSSLKGTFRRNHFDCHYCSADPRNTFNYLTSLPFASNSTGLPSVETDQTRYFHLLNHTYEEIGECGHLLMDNNHSETYRLFETKSQIHSILINLIETLFTNFLHSDTYMSELIEQYSRFLHIFYGHWIPFILQNLNCLFEISMEKCLSSSLEILATIFRIACSGPLTEEQCLLCMETTTANTNLTIQNCTLLFADEIQRVRLHYSNLERRLNNKNSTSEYSSTSTGLNKMFEVDHSIANDLIEYLCSHADEMTELLKNHSSDNKTLLLFFNLVQMYRSTGKNVM